MRALELKMQAFGPFKDETFIDFDKFGKQGIYLISGSTGAGKTSIFDAISYALFGQSSGGERDEHMLRYTGASPDIETFVQLKFEYKTRIYEIKRVPTYFRYKKTGEGLTDINTKYASIKLPDNKIIEGPTEVNKFIFELLGIDSQQFAKIAMLAQGNFMALLKADNKEKMELFRKIFSTYKFEELEKDIFDKYRNSERRIKELDLKYQELISSIEIKEEDLDKFEEIKNLEVSNIVEFVNNINKVYLININTIQKDIDNLEDMRISLIKKLEKVKEYHNNQKELNLLNEKFEDIKIRYQETSLKKDNIVNIEKENEDLSKKLSTVNLEIEKFYNLDLLLKEKQEEDNKLEVLTKQIIENESKIVDLTETLQIKNEFINSNQDIDIKIIKLDENIIKVDSKIELIQNILTNIEKLDKYNKDLDILKEDYKKLNNELMMQEMNYKKAENIFFESQAGILASDLEENMPCPVCGSINHPKKAVLIEESITKDEVDILKEKVENIKNSFNTIRENILSKNFEIKNLQENNEKLSKNLDIGNIEVGSLSKLSNELELINIENKNNKNEYIKIKSKLFKEKEDYEIMNNDLNEKTKIIQEFINQKVKLETIISRLENSIEKERANLGYKEKEDYEKYKNELEISINKNKKLISEIRQNFEEINNEYIQIKTNIRNLESKIDDKYDINFYDIEKEIKEKEIILKTLREEENSTKIKVLNNEIQINKLEDVANRFKEVEKQYTAYSRINNLLKGNIKGLANIKFETFVQMRYVEEIVYLANKRFHKMTDGQFSLQIKKEADNLKEIIGLGFEVIDHHNKTVRNINTLSGGESFQAALSLALGLSDVVQARAGGIQIDSMFIDEGFGTLDNETLSKVMNSLLEISSFNKIIGIISHVENLKEQIDKKILVSKDPSGYSKIVEQIY